MTTHKNVKRVPNESVEPCESGASRMEPLTATGRQPAGRIVHDERGNATWKWAGDPSSTGTSSGILKYIDPRDLTVEAQNGESSGSRGSRTGVTDSAGGYDPYNQGELRGKPTVPGKKAQAKR